MLAVIGLFGPMVRSAERLTPEGENEVGSMLNYPPGHLGPFPLGHVVAICSIVTGRI